MDISSTSSIDKSDLEKLVDLENVFKNSINLTETDEEIWGQAVIYLTPEMPSGEKYIIKKDDTTIPLIHEYRVGDKLNTIHHPNLIKTILLLRCPNWDSESYFLVLSLAKGKNLNSLYGGLEESERHKIVMQLCMIISNISRLIKFTHYDLHFNNIMIDVGQMQHCQYSCYGDTYSIISPYDIKIIDYGLSYVEGVYDTYTNTTGPLQNVHDDLYDLSKIISHYFLFYKSNNKIIGKEDLDKIANLINSNYPPEFKKYTFGINMSYWRSVSPFISIFSNPYYNNKKSIPIELETFVEEEVSKYETYFNIKLSMNQPDKDRYSVIKNEIKKYDMVPKVANMISDTRKKLGGVMKYCAERAMDGRTLTPRELLQTFLNLTSQYLAVPL